MKEYDTPYNPEPESCSLIECPGCGGMGTTYGVNIRGKVFPTKLCELCQGDGEVHPQTARIFEIERNFELNTIKNQI